MGSSPVETAWYQPHYRSRPNLTILCNATRWLWIPIWSMTLESYNLFLEHIYPTASQDPGWLNCVKLSQGLILVRPLVPWISHSDLRAVAHHCVSNPIKLPTLTCSCFEFGPMPVWPLCVLTPTCVKLSHLDPPHVPSHPTTDQPSLHCLRAGQLQHHMTRIITKCIPTPPTPYPTHHYHHELDGNCQGHPSR